MSPSHHTRQTEPKSPPETSSPTTRLVTPMRGGDRGAPHRGQRHEREQVPHPLQRGEEAHPAQQVGADDALERVAARDPQHRDQRHPGPRVRQQRPERHPRPHRRHPQDQRRERDPGRRPDRRDAAGREGEVEPDLGGAVVGPGDQRELRGVDGACGAFRAPYGRPRAARARRALAVRAGCACWGWASWFQVLRTSAGVGRSAPSGRWLCCSMWAAGAATLAERLRLRAPDQALVRLREPGSDERWLSVGAVTPRRWATLRR